MDDLPTGYEFDFVDPLSPEKECAICRHPLRNPVQLTSCGHRYCKNCLKTLVECSEPECPQDREPIPPEGEWFHDQACEREILSLRVKCTKNEQGCEWIGELSHFFQSNHIDVCPYKEVTCEVCNTEMERRSFNTHVKLECPNRIVKCEHCEEELEFWTKESHQDNTCPRFPVKCPQGCKVVVRRMQMELHLRDCMMTTVYCPYKEAGCTFQDKRSNLRAHIEASSERHLRDVSSKLSKTTEQLKQRETETKSLKKKLMKQDEKVIEMQVEIATMKNRLSQSGDGTEKIRELSKRVNELEKVTKTYGAMEPVNQLEELRGQLEKLQQETESTKTRVKELEVMKNQVAHLLNWKTSAQRLMGRHHEQIMKLWSSLEKREGETSYLRERVHQLESRDDKTVNFMREDLQGIMDNMFLKLKATLEKQLLNQVNSTKQFMRRNRKIKKENRFAAKRTHGAFDPLYENDDDENDIPLAQKRMRRNLHAAKKRGDETIDDGEVYDHY